MAFQHQDIGTKTVLEVIRSVHPESMTLTDIHCDSRIVKLRNTGQCSNIRPIVNQLCEEGLIAHTDDWRWYARLI